MGRRGVWGVGALIVLIVGCVLAAAGCALPWSSPPTATISGTIAGQDLTARLAGGDQQAPLLGARITCNGTSATAADDGAYSLTLPRAAHYTCTATDGPDYYPIEASLEGGTTLAALHVAFNGDNNSECKQTTQHGTYQCARLSLHLGSVAGTVRGAHNHKALSGARIHCAESAGLRTQPDAEPSWLVAGSDAQGAFQLTNMPTGTYLCYALTTAGATRPQQVVVKPNGAPTLQFLACDSHCPAVRYHGGRVMHALSAYVIFWAPPSATLDPSSGDAAFQAHIQQYFRDVGASRPYSVVTQYWDYLGAITPSVSLAGVWVDHSAYQHCDTVNNCRPAAGTTADPLYDDDIQAEINRAIRANHWSSGYTHEIFVYTAANIQACYDVTKASCSFGSQQTAFCGYHSFYQSLQAVEPITIYAYISTAPGCRFPGAPYPNGDGLIEAAINATWHEHTETITDPVGTQSNGGWFDDRLQEQGEVADICVNDLQITFNDGGNTTLNHGHDYLLQPIWSNATGGCAL
ncbi:MAG TPA: hypothetical protein VFY89_09470 [Ktedonobacterales bacterium]